MYATHRMKTSMSFYQQERKRRVERNLTSSGPGHPIPGTGVSPCKTKRSLLRWLACAPGTRLCCAGQGIQDGRNKKKRKHRLISADDEVVIGTPRRSNRSQRVVLASFPLASSLHLFLACFPLARTFSHSGTTPRSPSHPWIGLSQGAGALDQCRRSVEWCLCRLSWL